MRKNTSKSKRGNNEGSIYKRSDGRWVAVVTVPGSKRKYIYGKTRELVAQKLTSTMKSVQDGIPIPSDTITVASFAREWLESIKPIVKETTWEQYESIMRVHVIPSLGRMKLAKLEPRHLERFYAELPDKGLSPETVRNYHRRIHTMLEKALRLGMVARNVSRLVDLPRQPHKEMPMLTGAQVRDFLNAAKYSRLDALFVLAVTTGARQGELLGLSWDRVNARSGEIDIRHTLQRINGKFALVDPKTKQSIRTIALSRIAADALQRHRRRQMEEALRAGPSWNNARNLVFTTEVGTPIEKTDLRRRELHPQLTRAGLTTALRFHDLRHVAASLLLGQGLPITLVSEMLGHVSAATTLAIYAHAIPGERRQVADAMDKILAS